MTTSANVTKLYIFKDGKFIKTHSQHHYCKSIRPELEKYCPAEDYEIEAMWLDEDEWEHYSNRINLKEYLNGQELEWEQFDNDEDEVNHE